jgi:lipopolysaccharide biosynthesis glycosyltransferase
MNVLRVFIGYDSREVTAYHVLCDSIMRHTSTPVSITPLIQQTLRNSNLYTRDIDGFASTEFSLTRFLVPALSNYEGYSLFLDCDMLVQTDLTRLFQIAYDRPLHACHVVKHDYTPSTRVKMDHQVQTIWCKRYASSLKLSE